MECAVFTVQKTETHLAMLLGDFLLCKTQDVVKEDFTLCWGVYMMGAGGKELRHCKLNEASQPSHSPQ